jgi:DNA-binding NtrC family response regulator
MARTRSTLDTITRLLDESDRPIYAIDSRRRVVYCNAALAQWLQLDREQIVGRLVEYHSELAADAKVKSEAKTPLTDLCPPPNALAGEASQGTISCAALDGRLIHRRADFVPLHAAAESPHNNGDHAGGVLVLLSPDDLSPQEVATDSAHDPSADQLHRTIRQFRKQQARHYSIASLLGNSPAMSKVRAQVAAAAASGANVIIYGRPGSGRGHVARAIHYHGAGDATARIAPIDCELANDDLIRRALDAIQSSAEVASRQPCLLLEKLDRLDPAYQAHLLSSMRNSTFRARVIATCGHESAAIAPSHVVDPTLRDAISVITIEVPPLRDRLEDVPVLAQCFLEACNQGSDKQVGAIRSDALERVALYRWPGELDELRDVIAAAHTVCETHEITLANLPPVLHHAAQKAARAGQRMDRIVLDDLLARIEREAIVAALAQANGNKTDAAELLGMTRPRLYRRLVQLGLVSEVAEPGSSMPEFVERLPEDDS